MLYERAEPRGVFAQKIYRTLVTKSNFYYVPIYKTYYPLFHS